MTNVIGHEVILDKINEAVRTLTTEYPQERHRKYYRMGKYNRISRIKFSMPVPEKLEVYRSISNRIGNVIGERIPSPEHRDTYKNSIYNPKFDGLMDSLIEANEIYDNVCNEWETLIVGVEFSNQCISNISCKIYRYDPRLDPIGHETPFTDALIGVKPVCDDGTRMTIVNVFRKISTEVILDSERRVLNMFNNGDTLRFDSEPKYMPSKPSFLVLELHGNVTNDKVKDVKEFVTSNFPTSEATFHKKGNAAVYSIHFKDFRAFKKFRVIGGKNVLVVDKSIYWYTIKYGFGFIERTCIEGM